MNLMNQIKKLFSKPNPTLAREAFEAYISRLPDKIKVSWFRDGDFIIGKVSDGHHEFMTQAKTGEEFIEMVNDAIYTVNNIPTTYLDVVRQSHAFIPPREELIRLNDGSIKEASISFQKNLEFA